MKNLVKKSMVPAFASALLILAAGQAQAVSVSVLNTVDAVDNWFTSRGAASIDADSLYDYMGLRASSTVDMLENFESVTEGWYATLGTGNVGTFTATGEPGTGSSAYTGGPEPRFEIRDYDANGRENVYPWGIGDNYLDSADVSEITWNLKDAAPDYGNLFFTLTDPSDVGALTTVGTSFEFFGGSAAGSIEDQLNGSLWFVGVDGQGEILEKITLATTYAASGNAHTNDGFGIDSIGTVRQSVPEPATALLLGAGLLPLMGFLRRKKEDEM